MRSAILHGNRPFCVFEPPLGDLGATYDDHLRLIGKRVVDFLLVLMELFSLRVTAEELRANIGWKSAISLQRAPVDPKFKVEMVVPHQPTDEINIAAVMRLFVDCKKEHVRYFVVAKS